MLTILLYRILFWPVFLLVMPYYAYRMKRRGGYDKDFKYRFGMFAKLPKRKFGKRRLWIQAVSVGEIKALEKLVSILAESDMYEIVITTTTSTGYELAQKMYSDKVLFVGLFPFDFWLFSWMAWNRIFPHVVILMENEIWPEHVWQAKRRGVPVILINARISDKTFKHYELMHGLAMPVLSSLNYVMACDQLSAQRCANMGISQDIIKITGNMKFDSDVCRLSDDDRENLLRSLGFSSDDKIILGSSTWQGEELMLIKALRKCRECDKSWKLLLVPRHAERRNNVIELLQRSEFKWHQRSNGDAKSDVDICLVDTTGELSILTSLADIAFIGKSLSPNNGGQSPLDAASSGVPIVYGPRMNNFREICSALEMNRCVAKVNDGTQAISAIVNLSKDSAKREEMSCNLLQWHKSNCGASLFVAKKIEEIAFADK